MGTNLEQKIDVSIVNTFIWKNLEEIGEKIMISTRRLVKIYQNLDYFAAASESQMRNSKNILEIHNENGVREGIKLAKTLLENAERQELA